MTMGVAMPVFILGLQLPPGIIYDDIRRKQRGAFTQPWEGVSPLPAKDRVASPEVLPTEHHGYYASKCTIVVSNSRSPSTSSRQPQHARGSSTTCSEVPRTSARMSILNTSVLSNLGSLVQLGQDTFKAARQAVKGLG